MSLEKITIPDLGDSDDVEVIEVLVSPGDEIQENDSLLVLETDKAAMEIPATISGLIKEVLVKVGDTVNQGHEIIVIEKSTNVVISEESSNASPSGEVEAESSKETIEKVEQVAEEKKVDNSVVSIAEIVIPDLGTDEVVEVIDVLVSIGESVSIDDGLLTLETDKAAMDIPSPSNGRITDIKAKVGDMVTTGAVIMLIETSVNPSLESKSAGKQESINKTVSSVLTTQAASTVQPISKSVISPKDNSEVYAGPATRKLARELGVDLTLVVGTGTKNRILTEDVQVFVKTVIQGGGTNASDGIAFAMSQVKDVDFSQFGAIEEVEMSKLHQVTSRNMSQNWLNIPHVTQFEEADVTDLEDFRVAQKVLSEKKGIKLSPLPFIVKACAQALLEFPQFNVSMYSSGSKLIQKKYVNIGVAVATPAGLMVPVVKNVDQKSVWDIAAEIAELSQMAKDRKLTKELMEGGCFTISSLGNLGGIGFTPIVNAPEIAILGVSKTTVKPVWKDNEFVPRKILPFSLSYDHRAVDGVDGGLFCSYLNSLLSDIRLMVL